MAIPFKICVVDAALYVDGDTVVEVNNLLSVEGPGVVSEERFLPSTCDRKNNASRCTLHPVSLIIALANCCRLSKSQE